MSGSNAAIILLSLALCGIYCFVALRWTRGFPPWLKRPARSFLLALLCPAMVTQEDDTAFGPVLYFITFGIPGLKWGDVERLIIQVLVIWGISYALWLVVIGSPSFYPANPNKRRLVRLAAIIFSFASWISTAAWIYFWQNATASNLGEPMEMDALFTVLCGISLFGGLVSMTLVLFSMDESRTIPSDILWTLWAAVPTVLVMFLGVWLWFSGTFDNYA